MRSVKGYLTLHACVGVLALIIFIFHVITLNSESGTVRLKMIFQVLLQLRL